MCESSYYKELGMVVKDDTTEVKLERATREDVSKWFDVGLDARMTHLIIIQFNGQPGERPLFISSHNDPKFIKQKYEQYHDCRVFEVYNLKMDKEEQLNSTKRCWNF